MKAFELSDEQLAALDPGVSLLEACPGSGKTRTVVQRFKTRAILASKGIALLSFTNAAVDEATSRCSDQPNLLKSPNFVGTFDSFIHRYTVTPELAPALGKAPTYLEAWSSLSISTALRVGKQRGRGIDLSSLQHDSRGGVFIDSNALGSVERGYFNGLASDFDRKNLVDRGIQMIMRLNKQGLYDCDSARAKALAILRSDRGPAILSRLSNRFQEVMIDEFQDCSGVEHEIINLLVSAGIQTLVVADADQAIYEFRGATAAIYDKYRSLIPEASRRVLVDNYRSTPAICTLLSSVRTGRKEVMSTGSFDGKTPAGIFLIVGASGDIGTRFSALAEEWQIEEHECIALAHSTSDAQKLGSGIGGVPRGTALTTRFLKDMGVLRQKKSPTDRRKAVFRLEATILSILEWPDDLADQDTKAKLAYLGLEPRWLRLVIGRLVRESEDWVDSASCKTSLVTVLGKEMASLNVGFGKSSLKQKMGKITPEAWTFWAESKTSGADKLKLPWSTIHGAKGNEYDAVLLDIPSKAAESAWMSDEVLEEKRVFYVGASRARRMLAIATPKSRLKALKANLDAFGVPYDVVIC